MVRVSTSLLSVSLGLLGYLSLGPAAVPDTLPVDVRAVATGVDHRITIRHSCGREHCTDSAVLEWIDHSTFLKPKISGSTPVKEVDDNLAVVQSVRYVGGDQNSFELLLERTYGDERAWLCLWPGEYPKYETRFIPEAEDRGLTSRCSRSGPSAPAADLRR